MGLGADSQDSVGIPPRADRDPIGEVDPSSTRWDRGAAASSPSSSPPPPLPPPPPPPPAPALAGIAELESVELAPPTLFLSYRTADTGQLVGQLAAELRSDFGRSSVFRDDDDLVAGQKWLDELDRHIAAADGVVAVIGPAWSGPLSEGAFRIDAEDDIVRREVLAALDPATKPTVIPVFVDVAANEVAARVAGGPLEAVLGRHGVETTRADLVDASSVGYQRLLVGAWCSLTENVENAVLIIGDHAIAQMNDFIQALLQSTTARARDLSRIGANTYSLSVRQLKRKAKQWPDVIVLVDSADDRRLGSLMRALDEHPRIRHVALVGTGALAGGVVAAVAVNAMTQSSTTTVTTYAGAAQFAGTVPTAGSTALLGSGRGLKAVAAATAVGAVGAAVVILPDPQERAFTFDGGALAVVVEDDRSYPLGLPDEVRLELGPDRATEEVGDLGASAEGFVQRSVVVALPGEEPIDFGEILVPTGITEDAAELNSDGMFTVVSARAIADLGYDQLAPSDFCFEVGNPQNVLGGWAFVDGPATVEVFLNVEMRDGGVESTAAEIVLRASSELVIFEELDEGFDLSECPQVQEATALWQG